MSKGKLFLNLIGGLATATVIAGGVACVIPQSRNALLNELAPHSEIYKEITAENVDLKAEKDTIKKQLDLANSELEETKIALANKTSELETTKASLNKANSELATCRARLSVVEEELATKNQRLAEVESLLETSESNVVTLQQEKAELQSQITILNKEKNDLQSRVNTLNSDKQELQLNIDNLTSEISVLNSTITELNSEIAQLNARVEELNSQLAEYEIYKVEIDKTNPISAITIEDTKLGTIATLTNFNVDVIELYSWQNLTITYEESESGQLFVTLNNVKQETNTITLNGFENKGSNLVVGSIIVIEEQLPTTNVNLFTFNGNILTGYIGTETDIVIPSSYSLGEAMQVTKEFSDSMSLMDYCMEKSFFEFTLYADGTDTTINITCEDDLMNYMGDIDMMAIEYGSIKFDITEQPYIEGNDYQVDTIGDSAFHSCSNLTSVVIPSGVTTIGNGAFMHCTSITSLKIPYGVTSIGEGAFSNLSALTSLEIPTSITTISNSAFIRCKSLKNIEIPSSVKTIGDYAFQFCDGLESIVIQKGVESISYNAFNGCSALTTIYYTGSEEDWNLISINSTNEALLNAEKVFNYVVE